MFESEKVEIPEKVKFYKKSKGLGYMFIWSVKKSILKIRNMLLRKDH